MPNAFVILLIILVLVTVLTWILPAGAYDRIKDEEPGREPVAADNYRLLDEASPVGPWGMICAVCEGLVDSGDIIDTAVHGMARRQAACPRASMLIVQNIVNFFIPSGSG